MAGTPSVDALGWLAGCWRMEEAGAVSEECWMPPRGGIMLGLHRDVATDRTAGHEYLRLEVKQGQVVSVASPGGQATTEFRLVEAEGTRAVFANEEHDFPKQIVYEREGDTLAARVDGVVSGQPRHLEWRWKAVPLVVASEEGR